jgi:hypothetical protein
MREDFIWLLSRMSYYLKLFENVDETTPEIHDFILKFDNTKFYFISSVVYVMK